MSRLKKIVVALPVVVGLIYLAMPLLLSSERVKSRIEERLTELAGRQVALEGSSSLTFFPYLGISYSKVTLGQTGAQKPFVTTDGIRARMSFFSALTGDPDVSEVSLIRPRFHLEIDQSGKTNWSQDDKSVSTWFASKLESEVAKLGTLEIQDGIFRFSDQRSRKSFEVSSINGKLDWPNTASSASFDFAAVWQGEVVKLNATWSAFLELLKGGLSPTTLTLSSKPLELSLNGQLDSRAELKFAGDLSAESPSLRRLSEWTGQSIGLASLLGSLSLSGTASGSLEKLTVESASLNLDGHTARGRLQLERMQEGKLAIGGTLAFNTLSLPNFQNVSLIEDSDRNDGSSIVGGADFDLRLSAETATSGTLNFDSLAATALVSDGTATFDIGQTRTLGGVVSGTFSYSAQDGGALGANINMQDVELDQLSVLYGKTNIVLAGNGNAKFKLQSKIPTKGGPLQHLNGEVRVDGNEGKIVGVDLTKVITSNNEPQNLDSVEFFSGSTSYNALNLGFHIANGVVFFKDATLDATGYQGQMEGRGDLVSRSLAVQGRVCAPAAG